MPDDDRHSGVLWSLAKESGDDFVESRDPVGYALDDKGRYMFDLFDSTYLDAIDTPANVINDEQDLPENKFNRAPVGHGAASAPTRSDR